MIAANSTYWNKYTAYVLHWEGGLSKDPNDTAVSCAPFRGAYHTNKGVTYCTFKTLAAKLGITPVSYDRFVNLSNYEIGLFLYEYYKAVRGDQFYDSVALSMTEAAWGSGSKRAITHLQDALNAMGKKISSDGVIGSQTITAAKAAEEADLFKQYWIQRKAFIDNLTSSPAYAMYKSGWNNRIKAFLSSFSAAAGAGIFLFLLTFFF